MTACTPFPCILRIRRSQAPALAKSYRVGRIRSGRIFVVAAIVRAVEAGHDDRLASRAGGGAGDEEKFGGAGAYQVGCVA